MDFRERHGKVAPVLEHRICQMISSRLIMTIGGTRLAAQFFAIGTSLLVTKPAFAVGNRSTSPGGEGKGIAVAFSVLRACMFIGLSGRSERCD